MKHIIKSIKKTYNLYKSPLQRGDLLEFKQTNWIIIGIEEVSITYSQLEIVYTCQNTSEKILYQPDTFNPAEYKTVDIVARIRTGKEHILKKIQLGKLVWIEGKPYQSVGYTDVSIEYTDIVVSFLGRPIRPIPFKEVKAKLLEERKKALNLQLI